jgi:actin-related protein 8
MLSFPFSRLSARHTLAYGGDDLTTFLSILLRRSQFPYKTLDLNRSHDFSLIEGLKESLCTLSEVRSPFAMSALLVLWCAQLKLVSILLLIAGQAQIGISVSPFYVRKSKTPTKKYTVKTFDEVILAPMVFHISQPYSKFR